MPRSPSARSLDDVVLAIRAFFGPAVERIDVPGEADRAVDLWLAGPGALLAVEFKAVGDAARVGSALRQLERLRAAPRKAARSAVPIVAVPYMGETGRHLCAEARVSWIDLSGNAWIDAPGRQIRILGNPNRFTSRGRPANVFAPRSSRVLRVLLMEPGRAFAQSELVAASGLDRGRVSRLVRRLAQIGLVDQSEARVRVKDPGLALEAWREAYQFDRHRIVRGTVGGRGPEEVMDRLGLELSRRDVEYALTGLAGAWLLNPFAMFRTVTVLVPRMPEASLLQDLRFLEESRGANVWFAAPEDDGPLMGRRTHHGLWCAHPLQVYLDLKAHTERAPEAAAELRRSLFPPVADA